MTDIARLKAELLERASAVPQCEHPPRIESRWLRCRHCPASMSRLDRNRKVIPPCVLCPDCHGCRGDD